MTRANVNRLVLADTGFWIALYDPRDQYHRVANQIMDQLALGTFLFPWSLFYELLRTRFVRRPGWVESFRRVILHQRITILDDIDYRGSALNQTIELASGGLGANRGISLVDMVIRLVLEDPKRRVGELITFNAADFSEVCTRRRIGIRSSV